MRKILVIGSSGLLGSHLVRELSKAHDVLGTFNKTKLDFTNSIFFKYSKDRNELEQLLVDTKPDVIVNSFGLVTVEGCELQPVEALNLNSCFVDDLISVLENLHMGHCHLIQISTAGVYGGMKPDEKQSWKETDSTKPLSVYASSKLLAEYLCLAYKGPKTVIRSDLYGINSFSEKSLMWWIIKNAYLGNRMDDGKYSFSPISALHLSKIIRKSLKKT